jgi:hypothetical protein
MRYNTNLMSLLSLMKRMRAEIVKMRRIVMERLRLGLLHRWLFLLEARLRLTLSASSNNKHIFFQ